MSDRTYINRHEHLKLRGYAERYLPFEEMTLSEENMGFKFEWRVKDDKLYLNSTTLSTSATEPFLVLRKNVLENGEIYTFILSAEDIETGVIGESTIDIHVNMPPSGGYITATPAEGISGQDVFTLFTDGWLPEGEYYGYKFSYEDHSGSPGVLVPLRDFHSDASLRTVLPMGDPFSGYELTVIVTVRDNAGALAYARATVISRSPVAGSGDARNSSTVLSTIVEERLDDVQQTILSGDWQQVTSQLLSISSLLVSRACQDIDGVVSCCNEPHGMYNDQTGKCNCEDGYYGIDCSLNESERERRRSARERMARLLGDSLKNNTDINTAEQAVQNFRIILNIARGGETQELTDSASSDLAALLLEVVHTAPDHSDFDTAMDALDRVMLDFLHWKHGDIESSSSEETFHVDSSSFAPLVIDEKRGTASRSLREATKEISEKEHWQLVPGEQPAIHSKASVGIYTERFTVATLNAGISRSTIDERTSNSHTFFQFELKSGILVGKADGELFTDQDTVGFELIMYRYDTHFWDSESTSYVISSDHFTVRVELVAYNSWTGTKHTLEIRNHAMTVVVPGTFSSKGVPIVIHESEVDPGSAAYIVECRCWDEIHAVWQLAESNICRVASINTFGVSLELSEPSGEYAISLRTFVRSVPSPKKPPGTVETSGSPNEQTFNVLFSLVLLTVALFAMF